MRRAAALVVAVAAVLAGCSSASESEIHSIAPHKWGSGEVLHDLAPMVERVPALASAETVSYMGGPTREPDGAREITVPGPTDAWIDAIAVFSKADPAPEQQCDSGAAVKTPDVAPGLADELTGGPWFECIAGAFPSDGWWVSAWIDKDNGVVVLRLSSI